MDQIVQTVYGSYLQTCQYLKLPFVPKEHSTLNEKFQCNDDIALLATDMPHLKYVAIGNKGHQYSTGADGVPLINILPHQPTDAALYGHLPFVLRPMDNDLTPAERVNYRMRVIEEYDGVRYAAYYLRKLDFSTTVPQMEHREIDNGYINTTPFNPSVSNLNPVPPVLPPNGVLVSTGHAVAVTAKLPFSMSPWEINELLAACLIKYGDDRYAVITEIALVSGVDKTVNGEFAGVVTGYTDAIAAQVCAHIAASYAAKYCNTGIDVLLDIGAVNPLLFA